MSSHAQIWPEGAEKKLRKVRLVVGVGGAFTSLSISLMFWSQSGLVSQSVSVSDSLAATTQFLYLPSRHLWWERFPLRQESSHQQGLIFSVTKSRSDGVLIFSYQPAGKIVCCHGRLSDKVAIRNVCWWIVYHVSTIHYPVSCIQPCIFIVWGLRTVLPGVLPTESQAR